MDDRNVIKHNKKHNDGRKSNEGRSMHYYGTINKCRGMRRKADRTTHHRRRKINREEILHNGNETQILKSTTCVQKRNMSKRKYYNMFPMSLIGKSHQTRTLSATKFDSKSIYKPGLKRNRSTTKLKPYVVK